MSDLPLTGERVIEEEYKTSLGMYAIYLLHVASYRFAEPFAQGKRVLDLGCGSGYGAKAMASIAATVTAVDVSAEAIAFASASTPTPNLKFQRIDADAALPFADNSFDVVLSFQVIEHVLDDARYIEEARRVLTPDGVLIVITPNRDVRLFAWQQPWNRWHVREYDESSFRQLFRPRRFNLDMQQMTASDAITRLEIRRYHRLKWITLPVTLPFLPESWRIAGLNVLHAVSARLGAAHKRQPAPQGAWPPGFTEDDVSIGTDRCHALNLVAVARKSAE